MKYLKSRSSNFKNISMFIIVLAIALMGIGSQYASAENQITQPDQSVSVDPVTVEAYISRLELAPGESFQVVLNLIIDHEWHVHSSKPYQDYLIPTAVTAGDNPAVELIRIAYPEGQRQSFSFSPDEPLSVYGESEWIPVQFKIADSFDGESTDLSVSLTSQACDDRSCMAPETQTVTFSLKIDDAFKGGEIRHAGIFDEHGIDLSKEVISAEPDELEGISVADMGFWEMMKNFDVEIFIDKYGFFFAFIAMYILGLGLTLTPCVYPIIPITIGYFGSQSQGRWGKQFSIAFVYGLGIAISYATVGTIAAFSGALMGAALQSIWILLTLAGLCVAMGLNAFGLYELRLPGWFMSMAGGSSSRKGIIGAAIMGLTMGIASAPCLAAFIISLLAFIGQKGDPVLGFSLFFILGLGLATPFIILGTFSGMVQKIPKSGVWMVYVKKLMGTLLFAAALYFINTIIPFKIFSSIVMISLVAAGLYFGYFEPSPAQSVGFKIFRIIIGVIFITIAFWWGMPSGDVSHGPEIAWQTYSDTLLEEAAIDGKPVIIDFYADWCIPCKELDKISFADERVVEISNKFVALKSNLTRGSDPVVKKLRSIFDVKGVPTIVFLDPSGEELKNLRMVQFEDADEVLSRLEKLQKTIK